MTTVFISYTGNDIEIAKKLKQDLENIKNNIDVKMGGPYSRDNSVFTDAIAEQMEECRFCIPLLSEASFNDRASFRGELKLARQISKKLDRSYGFFIPVLLEECDPKTLKKMKREYNLPEPVDFFPNSSVGIRELIKRIYRRPEPSEAFEKYKLAVASGLTTGFVTRILPDTVKLLAELLGGESEPPKYNITYSPQIFRKEGGRYDNILEPDSFQIEIQKLRRRVIDKEMSYLVFFVDSEYNVIDRNQKIKQVNRMDAITLEAPPDTAFVCIGFGEPGKLEAVRLEFGVDKLKEDNPENPDILWAVYGPPERKNHAE